MPNNMISIYPAIEKGCTKAHIAALRKPAVVEPIGLIPLYITPLKKSSSLSGASIIELNEYRSMKLGLSK
jgi:hypothetical protein